jgi:hypothetical protein
VREQRLEPLHYLFNLEAPREQASALLRLGMLGIGEREPHREALAEGDLALVYIAAPVRELIGRAELASAVREWTPQEAAAYPGDATAGVLLAEVEEWDPPVPMSTVLAQIGSPTAKAAFDAGVVRISPGEYEAALAVAARSRTDRP